MNTEVLAESRNPKITGNLLATDIRRDSRSVLSNGSVIHSRPGRPGHHIADHLRKQLEDPQQWESLKRQFTHLRITRYGLAKLAQLEHETGLKSHTEALNFLLDTRRENLLPPSPELLLGTDTPIQIIGQSGAGKSIFMRNKILPLVKGALLVIDIGDEYRLRRISLSEVFEIDWEHNLQQVRFVPSSNPYAARGELTTLLTHLSMIKMSKHTAKVFPSGVLSKTTIVCEEGHRLFGSSVFRDFVSEARKYVRKLFVVASDPTLFGSVCQLVRPPLVTELPSQESLP